MPADLDRITALISEVGKIDGVGPDDDFYDAGFSSVSSLDLLLQLETQYDVSIPDDQFIAARSVRALGDMVQRLEKEQRA